MAENENDKSLVESIKDFLKLCPMLENNKIRVNYLGNEAVEYTIDPTPSQNVVREYLDGTIECRYTFNFSSREYYSKQVAQNIHNSKFYEDFANWLFQCTKNGNLPDLGNNKTADSIEAISSGYLFSTQSGLGMAKYTIQCALTYTQFNNK